MQGYIVRRLFETIPVLLVVTMIAFSLILLIPGDPVIMMLGQEATPEAIQSLRQEIGLDKPLPVQYAGWLSRAVQGDLGRSLKTREPISQMIIYRIPITAQLGLLALAMATIIGIPAGVVAATRQGSIWDTSSTFIVLLGVAMPNFLLGVLLIFLFALALHWLPTCGYIPPWEDLAGNLKLMIMPAVTLGAWMAATQARQTRSSMLEVLGQDYVRTARSKGLKEQTVIVRHALKNALIPVVTVLGLQLGHILGGSVIVETIFALPGIGRLVVDGIFQRDFPVVQGVVVVMAISVVTANLLVDITYGWLDPRIRYH